MKVTNLKVLIALREDLLNRVYLKTRDMGFQKEKYESLCLHVFWEKKDLLELIEKRITRLLTETCTQRISLKEILPGSINKYETPSDYIIERTLMRPRDIIAFVNAIIKRSDGRSTITGHIIKDAESEYSLSRFNALADEWLTDHPSFSIAAELFRGRKALFPVTDITIQECDEFCLEILEYEKSDSSNVGKIFKLAQDYLDQKIDYETYRNEYIKIFYEIGLVGLKLHHSEPIIFLVDDSRGIMNPTICDDTRVQVHKAFWRTLSIKET